MKYWEFHEPYYALIKATNKDKAIEKYIDVVSDDEDLLNEIQEVSRDYALVKFSQAPGENGLLIPVNDILKDFNARNIEVMLIDGSVI